jgi:hypothetical protein
MAIPFIVGLNKRIEVNINNKSDEVLRCLYAVV